MTTIDDLVATYEKRIATLVEVIAEMSDSLRNEIKENARLRAELEMTRRQSHVDLGRG